MEREIRRNRNNLIILGTGIIAFGAWSVFRTLGMFIISMRPALGAVLDINDEALVAGIANVMLVFLILMLAVDLILRVIVGLSARAEGKGTKKSIAYLIVAVILMLTHALSIGLFIYSLIASGSAGTFSDFISMLVEATAAILLLELIISSVKLRKLTENKQ